MWHNVAQCGTMGHKLADDVLVSDVQGMMLHPPFVAHAVKDRIEEARRSRASCSVDPFAVSSEMPPKGKKRQRSTAAVGADDDSSSVKAARTDGQSTAPRAAAAGSSTKRNLSSSMSACEADEQNRLSSPLAAVATTRSATSTTSKQRRASWKAAGFSAAQQESLEQYHQASIAKAERSGNARLHTHKHEDRPNLQVGSIDEPGDDAFARAKKAIAREANELFWDMCGVSQCDTMWHNATQCGTMRHNEAHCSCSRLSVLVCAVSRTWR